MSWRAFGARSGDHREWVRKTLRRHQEADGTCGECTARFGQATPWPCPPVRVAEIYSGFTQDPWRPVLSASFATDTPGSS